MNPIPHVRGYDHSDRLTLEALVARFQDHERRVEPNRRPGVEVASRYLDYLLEHRADGELLLAEVGGEVVGYVSHWVDAEDAQFTLDHSRFLLVSDLYIDPPFRRKGIGTTLLRAAEEFGRLRGVRSMRLNVLTASVGAVAMYRANGFREYEIVMERAIRKSGG